MNSIVFIDAEINPQNGHILDLGAVKPNGSEFHSKSQVDFRKFIQGSEFICGHNIFKHDLKYIKHLIDGDSISIIDTLYFSPLLFPEKPYHALLKDDKLQSDELNNPYNDSVKAMDLFFDEVNAFEQLNSNMKSIYYSLLSNNKCFSDFFKYLSYYSDIDIAKTIMEEFSGKLCANTNFSAIVLNNPIELAYCLALISVKDKYSLTPAWVLKSFPDVQGVMKLLRGTPCEGKCEYCGDIFDVHLKLKTIFGYDDFRKYNGEALQEKATVAAISGRSLLAVFPTGGGKSITFQLPALIAGEASKGLTVVISPLQSLMKDQVDHLTALGIADAVAVNGLLNTIERAEAYERVAGGLATILYISPESLRSKTIERLLLSRNVVRFVIDEAHCFSSWGQDFRVDYLYIGDFIKELQQKKNLGYSIPVSCFTATAKQKVISDIKDYFKETLGINLELYATNAARTNLRYEVIYKESEKEKYIALRDIIAEKKCPTIVYVARTKRTYSISQQLTVDGFPALPFNGKMHGGEKITVQNAFLSGETGIIVATSAFGMGVDKKDVKLVIHFDISDSLENYVQEAGRAGRDQDLQAECYVLFNENDLDKHFMLLNQTKLSVSEIGQVWKAIKDLTRFRDVACRSALEIARLAGWDDTVREIETRVKTAVSALEMAGYIKRGKNVPRVYATSILARNMEEAAGIINGSQKFNEAQKQNSLRIIKLLISGRSIAKAGNDDAETRVDYISDILGIPKSNVLASINLMREEGLLTDSKDLAAYIFRADNKNKSLAILQKYLRLEEFLISVISEGEQCVNLKEINDRAEKAGINTPSVKYIKTLLYYWTIKSFIQKTFFTSENRIDIIPIIDLDLFRNRFDKRAVLAEFIVKYLYERSLEVSVSKKGEVVVEFSVLELKEAYCNEINLYSETSQADSEEIEDALLYLAKTGSLNLEGGFLVLYSAMEIKRLELDNKVRYKLDDYKHLNEFYKQKIQQIHIVGEYANMMVQNYDDALMFVNDYFNMDYKQFITKYFKGSRSGEINLNITPAKWERLFGNLSDTQLNIINDNKSKYIVVTAGPGSGKTRMLVHKLASLMQIEDIKHEQLLMLTFSRAAATEFKKRLKALIGNAATFIEIKTFHSYCFDLLGKIGSLEDSDEIVKTATQMIKNGEVEIGRITKTVVVIDEAQDMDANEYALIEALMEKNEEMRLIAVGDDDQNIYEFRGSSSKYLKSFIIDRGATKYELLENYRSCRNIVELANIFSKTISQRLKTNPISHIVSENGIVRLIKHTSNNLEIPIVNNVRSTYKSGTVCVLTSRNNEALHIMGLFNNLGMKAKLIQSNDHFNLYNLAEFRYFFKLINRKIKSPIISEETWENAKSRLKSAYGKSECLSACLDLLGEFERLNDKKYKSDLEIFIRESQLSDFYEIGQEEIIVSTIHKSKGREFDNVYLMLNNVSFNTDESKRKIYVGLTRAKKELYIHYNNSFFDNIITENAEKLYDNNDYSEPSEIVIQLSHKDVFLGFFKDKKDIIFKLQSGCVLAVDGNSLYTEMPTGLVKVLIFSKSFQEKINELGQRGYCPYKAKVRFVVAWKDKQDDEESAVVLPDVCFRRNHMLIRTSSVTEIEDFERVSGNIETTWGTCPPRV